MNDTDKQLRALEKQVRLYKRRYENAMKTIKIIETIKDNYEIFYQSSLKEQEALNKQLEQLAWFDSLTGLPNRKSFDNFLRECIRNAEKDKVRSALLFIDLDGFKDINDTFGHTTGDQLLSAIAERLKTVIRDEDLLARLGGDEFVIVMRYLDETADATSAAERVIEACQQNVDLHNKVMNLTASVGIAIFPDNIERSSELPAEMQLQQFADLAMYRAKQQGKNRYSYYSMQMLADANRNLQLRKDTRDAISVGAFVPAFQPIYRCSSNIIAGIEALARWPQKRGNCVFPSHFMPTLERVDLTAELDFTIFEKTLRFIESSPQFMKSIEFVSVNFDARTFCEPNCYRRFMNLLNKYDVDSKYIVLELTESALVEHNSRAIKAIEALTREKIRLALDDFGTGYSGLSYLKRFPINIIKIDKYFSQSVPDDKFSTTIVKHLITMADDLGFEVIAEGVETIAQLNHYQIGGCDLLQGYLISKPEMYSADPKLGRIDKNSPKPINSSEWHLALSKSLS